MVITFTNCESQELLISNMHVKMQIKSQNLFSSSRTPKCEKSKIIWQNWKLIKFYPDL